MFRPVTFFVLVLAVGASACGSGVDTDTSIELLRVQSGDLHVVLLSDNGALEHNRDRVVVEFRLASDDTLVDVGTVKAGATMPMPGSSPMFGTVRLEPTSVPGRYEGTSDLSMAGTWRLSIEWEGPRGSGSANFAPMVQ